MGSLARFSVRDRYLKEAMRRVDPATDFELDEDENTQRTLRTLMAE